MNYQDFPDIFTVFFPGKIGQQQLQMSFLQKKLTEAHLW